MIYYLQTNLIAITVSLILLQQGKALASRKETSQIVMNGMLLLLLILSVSDIAAYYFRGKNYLIIEIANTLYFLTMAMGTYLWFIFILVKTGNAVSLRSIVLRTGLPVAVLCIAMALNPLTNFFFTIDDQLLYHRGPGIIVTWIVEWGYMFVAFVINVKAVLQEKRNYRRGEYKGYLLFALPLLITAACQMRFYGTTIIQTGYMIALLLVFVNKRFYQVQRDDLTGLNNRNAFLNFQDSITSKLTDTELTAFMVDADDFKDINDNFGHLQGDQALREIADTLKIAADVISSRRVIIFRYGGDEFVVIGRDLTQKDIQTFEDSIESRLEKLNAASSSLHESYQLSVSVGSATGMCGSIEEFEELIEKADQAMYEIKKAKKAGR